MKHSVLALTQGCKGVVFLCLKPVWWAYVLNSWPLNGRPLSVFNDLGIPNYAKILSSRGITLLTEVEVMMLTVIARELICDNKHILPIWVVSKVCADPGTGGSGDVMMGSFIRLGVEI